MMVALLVAAPTDARAQYPVGGVNRFGSQQVPGPFGRPTVSPYINLLRGNSPVLDYYGIVRPEVDYQQANARLETSLNQLETQFRNQQRLPQTANSMLTPTGRPSAFMTDIRGRPESITQDIQTRQLLLEAEAARTGRTIAPSGHSALFGNRGFFYRQGLSQ